MFKFFKGKESNTSVMTASLSQFYKCTKQEMEGFLKAVGLATTVLFMALIGALKLDQVLDGIGVIENLNFTVN